jgi:hypothetical protein
VSAFVALSAERSEVAGIIGPVLSDQQDVVDVGGRCSADHTPAAVAAENLVTDRPPRPGAPVARPTARAVGARVDQPPATEAVALHSQPSSFTGSGR